VKATNINKILAEAKIESAIKLLADASRGVSNRESYHKARVALLELLIEQAKETEKLLTEDDT
jgi:hypothetical protein